MSDKRDYIITRGVSLPASFYEEIDARKGYLKRSQFIMKTLRESFDREENKIE